MVLGIGLLVNLPIGPVFELTSMGILAKPLLLKPGVPTSSSTPDGFKLSIGEPNPGLIGPRYSGEMRA